MRDYSEEKIASIVTSKLPQLEFKEPQSPVKLKIAEEKRPTSDEGEKLTTINQSRFFIFLNACVDFNA